MFIYLPAVSILLTYFIFRSKGIDYRLIALGSLTPVLMDMFIGHASIGHSFVFAVLVLVLIMILTIGRSRLLRRRLLCIPIGMFFGLVLSGAFLYEQMWWWPFTHNSSGEELAIFPRTITWIIRDIIGLVAIYVIVGIGDLYKRENFSRFLRTGTIT